MSETWQLHNLIESLEKSSLLDDSQLNSVYKLARLPHASVTRLLSTLIQRRWLTSFQAGQLRRGRWKGFQFGHYRILHPLSSGGVGIVFLAVDTATKREVAIKVLRTQHRSKARFRERMGLEALALSLLQHDNIVRGADATTPRPSTNAADHSTGIHPEGSDDQHRLRKTVDRSPLNVAFREPRTKSHRGSTQMHWDEELTGSRRTYLAMELVKGPTLRELLVWTRLRPWWQACDYLLQAAQGLRHAHQHGFIHRDIKPDNLIVAPDGTVKLLDFGFAKYVGPLHDFETPPGHRVGTAGYIAPELLLGHQEACELTDLYSLGCTLYVALTGKHPFPGRTREDRVAAQLDGRFRGVRYVNHDVPHTVAGLVEKMICKSPCERIQSIEEVCDKLLPYARRDSMELSFDDLLAMREKARRVRSTKNRNLEQQRFLSDVARHLSFEDSTD